MRALQGACCVPWDEDGCSNGGRVLPLLMLVQELLGILRHILEERIKKKRESDSKQIKRKRERAFKKDVIGKFYPEIFWIQK